VTPSPGFGHQAIVLRLIAQLVEYLKPRGHFDQLVIAPADVTFAEDTVVEPDIFVADTAMAMRSGKLSDLSTLFLVIEVISPSTASTDRTIKRLEYQRKGIPQYWIVDGNQRQVEVWTPDATAPVIERRHLVWQHPSESAECVIDLEQLFNFQ